ncbi:hypothetical protein [Streptomyces brasiliscabiei]|uniref:hypothetical protein n=1 Tax=Streptomyces brasiliscabiei TaxID=2736302 RepID=UPI0038F638DA
MPDFPALPRPIAFVDCETTHLDAEIGEAWEVAIILRQPDGSCFSDAELVWQFAVDRTVADPEALRIGRFRERHLVDPTWGAAWTGPGPIIPLSRESAIEAIVHVLSGAVLVGSNPGFDDRFLRKLLGPGAAQWHYRPYDIVQLAAAKIGAQAAGPLPWRAHVLSRAVGVEPPTAEAAHTALGDARWARDVYDAAMVREKFPLSWEGRARHAIGLYTQTAIELEDARRDFAELRKSTVDESEATQDALSRAEGSIARVHSLLDESWLAAPHGADEHDHVCPDDVRKAVADALDGPSQPVNAGETPCTCTVGEACDQCADDDQDDEEFEEDGDADGDVFELISEIAGRLRDATDSGEYHAVGLIYDLANGRTTIADARAELADIEFGHV